jgi:hypothetical protein
MRPGTNPLFYKPFFRFNLRTLRSSRPVMMGEHMAGKLPLSSSALLEKWERTEAAAAAAAAANEPSSSFETSASLNAAIAAGLPPHLHLSARPLVQPSNLFCFKINQSFVLAAERRSFSNDSLTGRVRETYDAICALRKRDSQVMLLLLLLLLLLLALR